MVLYLLANEINSLQAVRDSTVLATGCILYIKPYKTIRCPSVCLSQHGSTAANQMLQVCCCGPGRQQQSAASECGQCYIVSVRR